MTKLILAVLIKAPNRRYSEEIYIYIHGVGVGAVD